MRFFYKQATFELYQNSHPFHILFIQCTMHTCYEFRAWGFVDVITYTCPKYGVGLRPLVLEVTSLRQYCPKVRAMEMSRCDSIDISSVVIFITLNWYDEIRKNSASCILLYLYAYISPNISLFNHQRVVIIPGDHIHLTVVIKLLRNQWFHLKSRNSYNQICPYLLKITSLSWIFLCYLYQENVQFSHVSWRVCLYLL